KILRKIFVVLLVVFCGPDGYAQSLRIVYDFIQDEVRYYKTKPGDRIGKEIGSPVVGRNKLVTIEVINFNKFVYAADAMYTSKTVEKQSDMGFLDIVSPLVNPIGSGSFSTALGGKLPDEIGRGSGLMGSRGVSSAYDDILDSYKKLTSLEEDMKSIEYAISKLNKLKYNPYLPTDTIVNMSNMIVSQIFDRSVMNPSDFSEVIVRFNRDYTNSVTNLKTATVSFLREYNDFANGREVHFEGRGLDEAVRSFNAEVNQVTKAFNPEYITAQIDFLETIYTSIVSTRYTFNSSYAAKDDEIDLKLNFYKVPIDDKGNYLSVDRNKMSDLAKIKEKNINIIVRGDIKVTSSVGLAFPKYKTSKEFIYRDSSIISVAGSQFSPNLGAYVNVYPYSGRTLQLGGTFGVGVPLQEEQKNVNMYMGVTALFGSDSRVGQHAGAILGQVKKLGSGYNIGDALLPGDATIPTRNIWEWGTFIGISFNIAKTGSQ
ncbi:MAG: hypothetical protein ACI9UJ_002174, partial [bacterium]